MVQRLVDNSISLVFAPDNGYRIGIVKMNNEDVTAPVFRAPLPQILNYPKNQAVVFRKVGKVSDPC